MNILFLTMSKMQSVENRDIYSDLIRKFRDEGHLVCVVSPLERRYRCKTSLIEENGVKILMVRTLNVQKTNTFEKGMGQITISFLYKNAIKKYFKNIDFDLILYSTPPITFSGIIEYVKRANPSAKTYLLLKDIFPQNAVDMGVLSKTGIKGVIYKFFRDKEKKLYALSDYIGCMSPANVRYLLEHNPDVSADRVEVAPNSIEVVENDKLLDKDILVKYNLPTDRPIFIYGGNLGVPQCIPFLIKCLEANATREDSHFLVIGAGTHYKALLDWYKSFKPKSVTVMNGLPKKEYDSLVQACHVGMIFLDYRFTIPNFPSRLLSYMEYRLPVVSCTDSNCDLGYIAEDNGFGFYVPSNDVDAFSRAVDKMLASDIVSMGERAYHYLKENYSVENTYNQIINHF